MQGFGSLIRTLFAKLKTFEPLIGKDYKVFNINSGAPVEVGTVAPGV